MTIAYITETNLDLTEGRGTSHPIAIHSHLGNALDYGKTAGVMGTSGGVSVYRLDSTEPVSVRSAKHGILSDHQKVIGSFRNGLRSYSWGVIPQSISELSDDEMDRLKGLIGILGDNVPKPAEPERGKETGIIGIIWAGFYGSIAGNRTRGAVPRVLALVDVVAVKHGGEEIVFDMERVQKVIDDARQENPDLGRVSVSAVKFGESFSLERDPVGWQEPQGFTALPERDQSALVAEYEALARKAGLL